MSDYRPTVLVTGVWHELTDSDRLEVPALICGGVIETTDLRVQDGATATEIRCYNYQGTTSEWCSLGWTSAPNKFQIGTFSTTGNPDLFVTAGGHLEFGTRTGFQVYISPGGSRTWRFRSSGQLEPQTTSISDLGSPTILVRRAYLSGYLQTPEIRTATDTDLSLNPLGTGTVTSTTDINGASPTEMSYLSGAVSNIQGQIDRDHQKQISWFINLSGRTDSAFEIVGEKDQFATGETTDYTSDTSIGNQHLGIVVEAITTGGVITVTGTSVSEGGGIPTPGITEDITINTTVLQRYQTSKKWLEITNVDISSGTITGLTYGLGRLGYLDMGNTNFSIQGMRCDILVSGNASDLAIVIEKVQDDGDDKVSIVEMENYGHDSTISGGEYFDNLRTGADDRSYTCLTRLANTDEMVVYKTLDYETFFTNDENILEGAAKGEGIIIRLEGRDSNGAAANIGSVDHVTVTLFYHND